MGGLKVEDGRDEEKREEETKFGWRTRRRLFVRGPQWNFESTAAEKKKGRVNWGRSGEYMEAVPDGSTVWYDGPSEI